MVNSISIVQRIELYIALSSRFINPRLLLCDSKYF